MPLKMDDEETPEEEIKEPARQGDVTVEGEDLEDTPEEPPEETPEEKPTRKAKRASRAGKHKELEEKVATFEADASAREERESGYKRRIDELERDRQHGRQQQARPSDQFNDRRRHLFKQRDELYDSYESKRSHMTKEDEAEFKDRGNRLQSELNKIDHREVLAEQPVTTPAQQYVTTNYPDIAGNPSAARYAAGEWEAEIHNKAQPNRELVDKVMAKTRQRFGFVASPTPSESTRAKFTGERRGVSSRRERTSVVLGKAEKKMAVAAYKDLEPEEAYKRFAKEIMKPTLEGR